MEGNKVKKIFVLFIVICSFLSGCSKPSVPQQIVVEGLIKTLIQGDVHLYGTSNLSKGASVKVSLKTIGTHEVLATNVVNVKEDGTFEWHGKRALVTVHELNVEFTPSEQIEEIQKKYGSKGELIAENSTGVISYTKNNTTYQAIKLYERLSKVGKMGVVTVSGSEGRLSDKLPPPIPNE